MIKRRSFIQFSSKKRARYRDLERAVLSNIDDNRVPF